MRDKVIRMLEKGELYFDVMHKFYIDRGGEVKQQEEFISLFQRYHSITRGTGINKKYLFEELIRDYKIDILTNKEGKIIRAW